MESGRKALVFILVHWSIGSTLGPLSVESMEDGTSPCKNGGVHVGSACACENMLSNARTLPQGLFERAGEGLCDLRPDRMRGGRAVRGLPGIGRGRGNALQAVGPLQGVGDGTARGQFSGLIRVAQGHLGPICHYKE